MQSVNRITARLQQSKCTVVKAQVQTTCVLTLAWRAMMMGDVWMVASDRLVGLVWPMLGSLCAH